MDAPTSSSYHFYYPHTKSPSYYRSLIEQVRKCAESNAGLTERLKGKGKGKEILYRYEGEVLGPDMVDGGNVKEDELVPSDPRKNLSIRRPPLLRKAPSEFLVVKYEVSALYSISFCF